MARKLAIIQLPRIAVSPANLPFEAPPPRSRLPYPYRREAELVNQSLARVGAFDWHSVIARATPWVAGVRANPAPFWAMESLLREYPISSAEGLAQIGRASCRERV